MYCRLWKDAHVTIQKHMGWRAPSRVPSIDTNHAYAKTDAPAKGFAKSCIVRTNALFVFFASEAEKKFVMGRFTH